MYRFLLGCFEDLETKPTYASVGTLDRNTKLKKWGSTALERLLASGFTDVDRITLVANPAGSTQPAYDKFLSIGFSWMPSSGPASLDFFVMESRLPAGTPKRDRVIRKLAASPQWDFGYGFSAVRDKDPDIHLIGGGSHGHSKEETRRIGLWYQAPSEHRVTRLRDVYEINLLNSRQLDFPLLSGGTLRDFILRAPHSRVEPVSAKLTLWEVGPGATEEIRESLSGTGVLITE
jgi:hypothetical protein